MAGLLGDFLSLIDTKKRNFANTVKGLLYDPMQELAQMGSYAMDPFREMGEASRAWQIGGPESPEKDAARKNFLNAGMATGLLGPLVTVYHGTPHKFDKFDLSKIGTGEGAQAYGTGIYFAENPNTAEVYRRALSDHAIEVGGKPISPKHGSVEDRAAAWVQGAVEAQSSEGPFQYAKKQARSILGKSSSIADDIINQIDQWQMAGAKVGKGGSLLKQDLPDEMIPSLLQWDKPLSQQPKAIREKLTPENLGWTKAPHPFEDRYVDTKGTLREWNDPTGEELVKGQMAGTEISKQLRSLGIPGLSYLDAGSRGGPKNPIPGGYYAQKKHTRNFVIWDEGLLGRMKPVPVE